MEGIQVSKSQDTPKMKYLKEKISEAEQVIKFQKFETPVCIGIVDIVNSTSVSAKLSNIEIAKYYTIFLNSVARIIYEHDGVIVKNIGDSLLYFFEMHGPYKDNKLLPLECGTTIIECRGIINEILRDEKLPPINYRVSSEYGSVMLAATNSVMEVDVFGSTVNYCAKINKMAEPGEFVIGSDLKTTIGHTPEFKIREKSFYKTGLKNDFPIYSVRK